MGGISVTPRLEPWLRPFLQRGCGRGIDLYPSLKQRRAGCRQCLLEWKIRACGFGATGSNQLGGHCHFSRPDKSHWAFSLGNASTLFKIERKTGTGGSYAQIGTVRDAISWLDTNLVANTQNYYR